MKKIFSLVLFTALMLLGKDIFAQSPVIYYKFENNPDSVSTPNCGYPLAGNAIGNLSSVTLADSGQFGKCLTGTGMGSSGITTGWNLDLARKSWTISMWVSIPSSASGSAYYLFGDAANSFRCFHNGVAGQDNLVLRGNGITDVFVSGIGPQPTVVTFVYDSAASVIRAYKNGVLANTVAQTQLNLTTGTGFKVGSYSASASFIGCMDEFRLYKRALSDTEVAAMWNHDSECGEANFGLLLPTPGANSNFVIVPYVPTMDGMTQLSIEAWVKVGSTINPNTILNKGASSFDYQLGINSTGIPFFRVQGTVITSTGIKINAGEWTHLAVTYDNADVKFYQNGVLVSSVPCITPIGNSNNEMRIGRGNNDPGSGVIEELRLWSVARTYAEINANKCRKYPSEFSSANGLKALWHFDGNFNDSVSSFNGFVNGIISFEELVFPEPQMPCLCPATNSSLALEACNKYTSPSGHYTWTASGVYNDTIANSVGCDSIITIGLIIHTADTSVTQNGIMLSANATGVTFQWVDCDAGYAVIPGANEPSFTPTSNGNYAVIITGMCTDTSYCHNISTYGIVDYSPEIPLNIYPNPNNGEFSISTGLIAEEIIITDVLGREILNLKPETTDININLKESGDGFYLIEVRVDGRQKFARVIVNR